MISIKVDTKAAVKYIRGVAERQIPYACMIGLNNTAFKVKDAEVVALEKHLDRPTPFTKRGYEVVKAAKSKLVASIRARAIQGEYLKYQIFGGSRAPKAIANVLPKGAKLTGYGNLPKGAIKRMLMDKKRYFSGVPKGGGPAGIYRRLGTTSKRLAAGQRGRVKLQLMTGWIGTARYKPRLPFEQVAKDEVARVFRPEFDKALARALSTAK